MSEIIQTIRRVRRAMPRNQDVMDICDWAERALTKPLMPNPAQRKTIDLPKSKLSRAEIQKNYRLRKKAIKK